MCDYCNDSEPSEIIIHIRKKIIAPYSPKKACRNCTRDMSIRCTKPFKDGQCMAKFSINSYRAYMCISCYITVQKHVIYIGDYYYMSKETKIKILLTYKHLIRDIHSFVSSRPPPASFCAFSDTPLPGSTFAAFPPLDLT